MGQFFRRRAALIVDGVRVDDAFTISFTVKKSIGKEPNTAEIKVSNLSEKTRSGMQKKGAAVVLSAGYEGSVGVIFSGDARTIDHVREGPSWTTLIQCGDGERAYRFARFSESFAPGTPIVEVIRAAAKALGLNTGNLEKQLATGGFRGSLTQFAHGYTAHGKAAAELDRLLRTVGLAWSVQDGALQILRGGAPADGQAVLLTPETGLIGSPEHGNPDKKGGPSALKATSLLQARLGCGGRVEIRSSGVKGQFRIEKVDHVGSTAGGDWYSKLETKAV